MKSQTPNVQNEVEKQFHVLRDNTSSSIFCFLICDLSSLDVKHKQMSQTPAESSGERGIVVGDWNKWKFCCYTAFKLSPELTFFLTSSQFIRDE